MTQTISEKIKLTCPYNIQFRYDKKSNIPYLLEINTRMSGGLYLSCEATHLNIANIALKQLCGHSVSNIMYDMKSHRISYVETGKVLD